MPGAAADVVVLDMETVDPGPLRRVRDLPGDEERLIADQPAGIEHVFVNGVAITRHGESLVATMTERPGRILRAARTQAGLPAGRLAGQLTARRRGPAVRAVVCYGPGDVGSTTSTSRHPRWAR